MGLTFNRLAVLGSITFRTSRTSWVRDEPTWPCLMMKDLGEPSPGVVVELSFRWVLFLRLRAIAKLLRFCEGSRWKFCLMFVCNVIAKQRLLHEPLGLFPRPIHPICLPSTILFSLKGNRIHISPQSKNPLARTLLHHPNLGWSCALRWPEGCHKPNRHSNGFRVCTIRNSYIARSYPIQSSNDLSLLSDGLPRSHLVSSKVAVMEKRISELDVVVTKLVSCILLFSIHVCS